MNVLFMLEKLLVDIMIPFGLEIFWKQTVLQQKQYMIVRPLIFILSF